MSFFLLLLLIKLVASTEDDFIFNGFTGSNLSIDGVASITSDGLLQLTNATTTHMKGHAFNPIPLRFKNPDGKINSFSTTFVFGIVPEVSYLGGNGLAFFISGTNNLSAAMASQYLGLFNVSTNGNSTDHILAVELDIIQNLEFADINDNHVGIDVNGLRSNASHAAGYYDDTTGSFNNLTLISAQPMQVWVDFDGDSMQLNVTLSPAQTPKPGRPLLSSILDLSTLMLDSMYVGFSSSTGAYHTAHYVVGWSFKMNGVAEPLDYAKLPSLPFVESKGDNSVVLAISLPVAATLALLFIAAAIVLVVRTRREFAEVNEDWEIEYGAHRFKYKDLSRATKGFKEKRLLGVGGFGRVYRGVLRAPNMEIAVKRVSHESKQGMKEFVAEIVSMSRLRHRNLVQLLGYCRRKGELLLVYDFMPNGSLDKFLYDGVEPTLNWAQRFRIIKGVASALLYLHEDCEQLVIHRDIKASNVLLDGDFNGRLGDFGLARLYDHGTGPQTTHVVGTTGYLAPELSRTGKATTATDVFAFGAFLLEVVCGRRPVEAGRWREEVMLVGWVLSHWQRGSVLATRDARLWDEYCAFEVELVLKLGLLCSNPAPAGRPSMRQVVQFLEGDVVMPEMPASYQGIGSLSPLSEREGSDGRSFSSVPSFSSLSGGR